MKNNHKRYESGQSEIVISNDISFGMEEGESVITLGPSGAGKSTALNILGGVDTNDEGNAPIDGKDISTFNEKELIDYRRNDVGSVSQFYNFVPNLAAKENVELTSEIVKDTLDTTEALQSVGLGERVDNLSAQLSGGEQQHVAIARAAAKNPELLLCDEPAGALNYNTGKQVLKILQDMVRREGVTVVIVTHNQVLAPITDRAIHMHDAKIRDIELSSDPQNIETLEY